MSEDNVWVPASGCFPCPYTADIGEPQQSNINPLPGFADLNRGYFSVPMSTWYLPISSCIHLGGTAVGEVNKAHEGIFFAIACHEQIGHRTTNTTTSEKHLQRFAAARAYESLWEIMHGKTETWYKLNQWNNIIHKITEGAKLVEELFATFFGIQAMKESLISPVRIEDNERNLINVLQNKPPKSRLPFGSVWTSGSITSPPLDQIEKIKKKLVRNQTKTFGTDFPRFYKKIDELQDKCGLIPFGILAAYVHELPDFEIKQRRERISLVNMTEENAKMRLEKGLEILKAFPYSSRNIKSLAHEDWYDFFNRWLLDFQRCVTSSTDIKALCEHELDACRRWWRLHETGNFNPVEGAMIATKGNSLITTTTTTGEESSKSNNEALRKIAAKATTAYKQDRNLVLVGPPKGESGLAFLPLSLEDSKEVIPFGFFTADWAFPSNDRVQELITMTEQIEALTFFEGLRLQVASLHGLRCPLRTIEWSQETFPSFRGSSAKAKCCGRVDQVMRLWEAGKKAGIQTWEKPTCLGS